jgi:protein gp37
MARRFVVTHPLATPALDWFLLTKRPQNIGDMLPIDWGEGWPHVWLGTTTENQEEANRRIPHLVAIPAAFRFLSVEPMVEPVDDPINWRFPVV